MARTNSEINPEKSLFLGIEEAGEMLGLSRNASYAAAARGDIPTMKFGRLKKVPKAKFFKMLEEAGAR